MDTNRGSAAAQSSAAAQAPDLEGKEVSKHPPDPLVGSHLDSRAPIEEDEVETYSIEQLKALLSIQADWQLALLERDAAMEEVVRSKRHIDEQVQSLKLSRTDTEPLAISTAPPAESAKLHDAGDARRATEDATPQPLDAENSLWWPPPSETNWREYRLQQGEALAKSSQSHTALLRAGMSSRRADLAARRQRLAQARDKVLKQGVDKQAAEYRVMVQEQKLELQHLHRRIRLRRQGLVQKLDEVYPIVPVDASSLLFSINGILLPVPVAPSGGDPPQPVLSRATDPDDPRRLLASAYEPNNVASGLALVVQLVTLLSMYLGIPLHYDVAQAGSWGVAHDGISPHLGPRVFPLYPQGDHERYRYEYAVFLLEKNVENLLRKLGMSVLDLGAILPNLKNLIVTYTSDPVSDHPSLKTSRSIPRTRGSSPASANGSPFSSAPGSPRSSWFGSNIRVLPMAKANGSPASLTPIPPFSPRPPSRVLSQPFVPGPLPTTNPVETAATTQDSPSNSVVSTTPQVKVRAFAPASHPTPSSSLGAGLYAGLDTAPKSKSNTSTSTPQRPTPQSKEPFTATVSSSACGPALRPSSDTSSFSSWLPWLSSRPSPSPAPPGGTNDPVPVLRTLGRS